MGRTTMSDNSLRIETAVNGFVLYLGKERNDHANKTWAFETPESLAKHILEWAHGNTKVVTQPSRSDAINVEKL